MTEGTTLNVISLAVGIGGSLLGGAVSWGVAKGKMAAFEKELNKQDTRLTLLESKREDDRNAITRIETTMQARFDEINRTLETIRSFLVRKSDMEP